MNLMLRGGKIKKRKISGNDQKKQQTHLKPPHCEDLNCINNVIISVQYISGDNHTA